MSGTPGPTPDELHVLAGEFVLGALDAAEMRAVRRQAMVDPALAAAIAGWERRLAPMIDAVPPLRPPDALWERISEAIAPAPEDAGDPVIAPRQAAAPPPPERFAGQAPPRPTRAAPERPARPRRGSRVWPWQLATAGSLALAACVAAVTLVPTLALRTPLRPLAERLMPQVAAIMPPDSHVPGFLAQTRPDGTVVLTALAPVDVPAGKSLELWILPPGAKLPRSLGVLPADGRLATLPTPLAAPPPAGTALLVSLEPPGGSPTGLPTGQVVYAGKLR